MIFHRLSPDRLRGSRAYFTSWNKNSLDPHVDGDRQNHLVLRKLKALLLTKSTIVFAASDFNSPTAFRILLDNPSLLDSGILVPALREDRDSLEDVSSDPAVRSFISDRSVSVVSWKLDENVDWFRTRFTAELEAPQSVIRSRLIQSDATFDYRSLLFALSASDLSVQDAIDQHAVFLSPAGKTVLLNYRSLLYHMSGARVVHSESFLPQENLIDQDVLSETARERLSEDSIFFKVFVEQALRTLERKQIPIEVLDQITMREILTLRDVYKSSGFIDYYDKMVEALLRAAVSDDPRNAIFHLNELEAARSYIFSNFTRQFEAEIDRFKKSKKSRSIKSLLSPSTSVVLGAAGLGLGPTGSLVASLLSLAKDSFALRQAFASMINTFHIFSATDGLTTELARQSAKTQLLRSNVGEIAHGSTLLEAAEKYAALVSEAYRT